MTDPLNNWESTAALLGGISRAKVFSLWKSGALASVTIGTRRFSSDSQIAAYVQGLKQVAS